MVVVIEATSSSSGAGAGAGAGASLYVGDLHPDVKDVDLINLFSSSNGKLSSVHICRDSVTKHSLGYAYVNFSSPHDASQAIDKWNNTVLNGKPIRIMWSIKDPQARNSGVGNVFVKNLAESINNAKLHDIFRKFGKITSCKVEISYNGMSKGYGFVQFESQESAIAAIANINSSMVEGKQMYVTHFIKKNERVPPNPDAKYTNLYMKNFDVDVIEELLREKFSEFGKVTSLVIAKDNNGDSKGFGFVNFESPDDAKRAVETMNGIQFGSKALYVARAQKKAERKQILRRQYEERRNEKMLKYWGLNLYVKNINDDVDDNDLQELFSQFGTITSAKVMRNDKGISKGFGFVCFSTTEEANKAVSNLHGYMFHKKPLYVAIAQRKEERQAQLQMQLQQRIAAMQGPPIIPGGFHPMYYAPPPNVIPQVPSRQGVLFQSMGLRPEWKGYPLPLGSNFQPMPPPMLPNTPRQPRQNRIRMNGYMLPQTMPFMSHMQQPTQFTNSLKDIGGYQQMKYMAGERPHEMNNGLAAPYNASNLQGSQTLSSMLAAAAPQQQKQILGERLFPLVEKHQPDLVRKITGMLLEMDNSELLLLLESPESMAAKVEEAVKVLELSKAKAGSGQDAPHPNCLSAKVAVN